MSTNPQEQWLQMLGAEMLRQQAAEQQAAAQPMDAQTAQAQRSWAIAADRARVAERRTIEAARERQRQFDTQREKEQAQAQQQAAERLERETKAQALQEWVQAGNTAATFESQWREQYLHIMQARVEERNAQAKTQWTARYGGF